MNIDLYSLNITFLVMIKHEPILNSPTFTDWHLLLHVGKELELISFIRTFENL